MSDTLKNPRGIPNTRYNYAFSMMNCEDGLAFSAQTCKETNLINLGSAIVFQHRIRAYSPIFDGLPNFERPRYIVWIKNDFYTGARIRVYEVLDMLCGHLGLTPPKVWNLENSSAIVIEVDKWFIKSPVTNHMLLTFIRSAIVRLRVVTSNVNAYVEDVVATDSKAENRPSKDYIHFTKSANLEDLLNKTHPCVLDYEMQDWYMSPNHNPCWLGIVGFNRLTPRPNKISLEDLLARDYQYTPVDRNMPTDNGYRQWVRNYAL